MAAAPASDIPPNQTLYINNLNEKLKKPALKKALFAVFSQFGRILDIVALKTLRLRGQAWVVFADVASATNAMRQMQGFPFYDKPMRIAFAKGKSDAVARREGTYVPRDKRKRLEEAEAAGKKGGSKRAATASNNVTTGNGAGGSGSGAGAGSSAPTSSAPAMDAAAASAAPNRILFARNLPTEATADVLRELFKQYGGFKEIRSAAGTGIAFIEFADIPSSTAALQGLNNFKLSHTHSLMLSYAK